MVLSFPGYLLDGGVDRVNRTFQIDPQTFCDTLRNQRIRVLRDATQLWYDFHNSHRILVVVFFFLWE